MQNYKITTTNWDSDSDDFKCFDPLYRTFPDLSWYLWTVLTLWIPAASWERTFFAHPWSAPRSRRRMPLELEYPKWRFGVGPPYNAIHHVIRWTWANPTRKYYNLSSFICIFTSPMNVYATPYHARKAQAIGSLCDHPESCQVCGWYEGWCVIFPQKHCQETAIFPPLLSISWIQSRNRG